MEDPLHALRASLTTALTYSRSGWRLNAEGSLNKRSDWSFWGLPGNAEFDQDPGQEQDQGEESREAVREGGTVGV